MTDLIDTPTYNKINKDLTATQERKITTKLLELRKKKSRPRLWKRYVLDTCYIVRRGKVDQLHLNSMSLC